MRCRGKKWNRPGNQDLGQKGGSASRRGGGEESETQNLDVNVVLSTELPLVSYLLLLAIAWSSHLILTSSHFPLRAQSKWGGNWQIGGLHIPQGSACTACRHLAADYWSDWNRATAARLLVVQCRSLFAKQVGQEDKKTRRQVGGRSRRISADILPSTTCSSCSARAPNNWLLLVRELDIWMCAIVNFHL